MMSPNGFARRSNAATLPTSTGHDAPRPAGEIVDELDSGKPYGFGEAPCILGTAVVDLDHHRAAGPQPGRSELQETVDDLVTVGSADQRAVRIMLADLWFPAASIRRGEVGRVADQHVDLPLPASVDRLEEIALSHRGCGARREPCDRSFACLHTAEVLRGE